MPLSARQLKQYHVFLASPGDVSVERRHVRQFFERYNQHTAQLWNVRFEVVDWENYSTVGVGRPQELITQQTLEKYGDSLALVIGIMAQRFGSPTGKAESGTEEEFNWAMQSHEKHGFPEIKWFFRKIDKPEMPTDPTKAEEALEQWKKVVAFKRRMQDNNNPVFYTEYPGSAGFRNVLEKDLNHWLADSSRPWVPERTAATKVTTTTLSPLSKYYENIERDFHRLDIAGIDNDRAFEIPLSEIYVRLRVMFDEDAQEETEARESGSIDIQTALLRYSKLVIVGDPGSGKSTFLKYIALMLARSFLTGDSSIALEKLCLPEPLPIPIFLSCWDLADFLKQREQMRLSTLVEFVADRLTASDFPISTDDVEGLLKSGNCWLLFDGLDEVPTDAGRAVVKKLLDDCVQRYADNRFAVTSRTRAYTGDTILGAEFTRCDIQVFDADDRAEFIRNWVALLFRIPPDDVQTEGSEAAQEFKGLTRGIEESDRIRALAVNPLLLTVIAIVHWNRKRLPEQRVDLYDECVDVLLGQRKEAEHIQLSRKMEALDEQREDQTHEERAWVRKRFAEIALHIHSQDGDRDEASKDDVIRLLTPRLFDQGAANEEQAAARAELFLERQELRSGLLVSRRAQSYRFVHLTFQEYLAAWQLSSMDFDKVTETIQPRLRSAKWFETLQLLGSQWAKGSDDKADRLVAWLLEQRGTTIKEQAPIVALCANILKDITGVADLTLSTRGTFKEAVEATLDAFRNRSGIPAKTQLEILEALEQFGGAVKSHLIDATKACQFQVRRRAIEMLLPHLSDDELFAMNHILNDRSKEPVMTLVRSWLERDPTRTVASLSDLSSLNSKVSEVVTELASVFRERLPSSIEVCAFIVKNVGPYVVSYGERSLLDWVKSFTNEQDSDKHTRRVVSSLAAGARSVSLRSPILEHVIEKWPDGTTRKLLEKRAVQDEDGLPRCVALRALAQKWPDETTRKLLEKRAVVDEHGSVRLAALQALAEKWPDENTQTLFTERAVVDEHGSVRRTALQVLVEKWPDENTQTLLIERAVHDADSDARRAALQALVEKWPDEDTRILLTMHATEDENGYTRRVAFQALAAKYPDENTRSLLIERTIADDDPDTRGAALKALAEKWPDDDTRKLLRRRAADPQLTTRQRGESCALLGTMHSEFGRILPTKELHGRYPYLDPLEPVPREHIEKAAKSAGVAADQIDAEVRSLSEFLGWDITKGARTKKRPHRTHGRPGE